MGEEGLVVLSYQNICKVTTRPGTSTTSTTTDIWARTVLLVGGYCHWVPHKHFPVKAGSRLAPAHAPPFIAPQVDPSFPHAQWGLKSSPYATLMKRVDMRVSLSNQKFSLVLILCLSLPSVISAYKLHFTWGARLKCYA